MDNTLPIYSIRRARAGAQAALSPRPEALDLPAREFRARARSGSTLETRGTCALGFELTAIYSLCWIVARGRARSTPLLRATDIRGSPAIGIDNAFLMLGDLAVLHVPECADTRPRERTGQRARVELALGR